MKYLVYSFDHYCTGIFTCTTTQCRKENCNNRKLSNH